MERGAGRIMHWGPLRGGVAWVRWSRCAGRLSERMSYCGRPDGRLIWRGQAPLHTVRGQFRGLAVERLPPRAEAASVAPARLSHSRARDESCRAEPGSRLGRGGREWTYRRLHPGWASPAKGTGWPASAARIPPRAPRRNWTKSRWSGKSTRAAFRRHIPEHGERSRFRHARPTEPSLRALHGQGRHGGPGTPSLKTTPKGGCT